MTCDHPSRVLVLYVMFCAVRAGSIVHGARGFDKKGRRTCVGLFLRVVTENRNILLKIKVDLLGTYKNNQRENMFGCHV